MSWVTVVWSAVGAACLTLGAQNLLIATRLRAREHLLVAAASLSAAALGAFELALMRAGTVSLYSGLLRGIQVPIFCLTLALVLFVREFFRAGRPWLAFASVTARGAALAVDFLHDPNLNFESISDLRRVPLLGELISVPDGVVSRWTRLGEASSLLLLLFLLDAAAQVWRRGERRRAVLVGGSMILFVLLAAGHTALVHAGVVSAPYLISLSFLPVVAAMGYELTSDVLRSTELARDLAASRREAQETDERLALAGQAAGLGFWTWDARSDRVRMTSAGRALRGFSVDAPLDLARLLSAVHPEDRAGVRDAVVAASRHGGQFEVEYRILRPDGDLKWIALRGSGEPATAESGARVLGASIDVTGRKRAEAEAQKRQNELSHLSRVTMLGELSGSIAHELNQPLTAILSNAQAAQRFLAQGNGKLGEVREILADIVEEDKHAGEVIRRLRALLRKGEVSPERLELRELVEDVLKLVRSDLINREVTVSTDVSPGLPAAYGDRVQIEQVLLNLLTNGCDAMAKTPVGDRRLVVRAEQESADEVRISVVDRGTGIPETELRRVFEPFVTSKETGMGLGLSVCRTIVTAHGGRLWASNNAGAGAAFHFTLRRFGSQPS
ncbi:MAG TPA: ATP-binding protein [Thermoanaerobaculia bacterium]|nr:ATP-binding protein [Thermoanaerobaculia bacterium]